MGDESQEGDDMISYQDLETAAFHNNTEFVQEWLQNSVHAKNKNFRQWRGELLRRAAYLHSVDVVECIVSYGGSCTGQLVASVLKLLINSCLKMLDNTMIQIIVHKATMWPPCYVELSNSADHVILFFRDNPQYTIPLRTCEED